MKPAIIIQNLTKQYKLTGPPGNGTFREAVGTGFKKLFASKIRSAPFVALNDISININRGERLGVIGPNGAGKSTLLKIISRITPPTSGRVTLNGRVASLLEVGTGFHPELTGRENIYLNGSILGLRKKEIDSRLEEIVSFSGVESFIDAPLKQYSSGMQLRLAFSVAAHLDPDILLIDEVLAVGDVEFQKKCIGKMEEVSRKEGRTILFVSHSMSAIRQLCTSVMVMQKGEVSYTGTPHEGIEHYHNSFTHYTSKEGIASFNLLKHPNKNTADEGIVSASIMVDGIPGDVFIPGHELTIRITYFLKQALFNGEVGFVIKDDEDRPVVGLNNKHLGKRIDFKTGTEGKVTIRIPAFNINKKGKYHVDLFFGDPHHFYECLYHAFEFTVAEEDVYRSGTLPDAKFNSIFIPNLDISPE
jgi:lipopolysaccharide transport system ATP-binding protein